MNDNNNDEAAFLREAAAHIYDASQFAMIQAIEQGMVAYAMAAWRPMSIKPPLDTVLITACPEGVVLMIKGARGWYAHVGGLPRDPPQAWMPCPLPPDNGTAH